jgi:hypothetical protein
MDAFMLQRQLRSFNRNSMAGTIEKIYYLVIYRKICQLQSRPYFWLTHEYSNFSTALQMAFYIRSLVVVREFGSKKKRF